MLNPMKINRRIDYMNELLQCIDQIDQSVNDAEINVLESLISSYDKALMILQECEVSDYSAFEIFQEGEKWDKFKEDTKAPILGTKDESVGKRILMLIPRLIQKLIALIRNLFSKEKSEKRKMDKDIRELERIAKSTDSVQESVVDDSDDEIVQEGLRDGLKQLKSEFSPKGRKERKAEFAKRREDNAYNHSQFWDKYVLDDFKSAISDANKLYEQRMFSTLCEEIQKANLPKAKDIMSAIQDSQDPRKVVSNSFINSDDDYYELHTIINDIRISFLPDNSILVRFIEDAGNIDSVLKNNVMDRLFKMINDPDMDTADRRKRYIRENLSEVKEIRDSINRLHDKRRNTIACIDRFAKDLNDIWKVLDDSGFSKRTRESRRITHDIYELCADLNKVVYHTFVLNKSIADCWNGLMHAMKGDGKADIANPNNWKYYSN
jgi:hypothetical protein